MVKVNQFGYLPNERKLAIVSYEPNAVTSRPDAVSGHKTPQRRRLSIRVRLS